MIKKILLGFGLFILVLFIAMVITAKIFSSTNNPKTKKEEILKSKTQSSKKALVVFQPGVSNFTDKIAHQIAKGLNDGGYEVTIDYPSKDLSKDVDNYSVIVFGSPVYGGKPLSIVTDYSSSLTNLSSKKIVVYSTGAGKNTTSELDIMEQAIKNADVYKKIKFVTASKKESEKNAYDLGKELSEN